ncbi:MAG: hypothetical protein Ta2E_11870 [Mycoplasmoidaceae bacterium]|nr:MAG: hypothetical protein Ta2E_11870 [Mycoplasmoidaceae bacterium]
MASDVLWFGFDLVRLGNLIKKQAASVCMDIPLCETITKFLDKSLK